LFIVLNIMMYLYLVFSAQIRYIYVSTVGYATTKNTIMNECYNEQFISIKSGWYNEHKCCDERLGITSADVAHECP